MSFFYTYLSICGGSGGGVCICVCLCMLVHIYHICTYRGQRTTCKGQFFLCIMWLLRIKLKSLGLAASAFISWTTSLAPMYLFCLQWHGYFIIFSAMPKFCFACKLTFLLGKLLINFCIVLLANRTNELPIPNQNHYTIQPSFLDQVSNQCRFVWWVKNLWLEVNQESWVEASSALCFSPTKLLWKSTPGLAGWTEVLCIIAPDAGS